MSEGKQKNFLEGSPDRSKRGKTAKPDDISTNTDPLTEEQSRSILDPVDVIRDPIHGDIHLTKLERNLIESSEFLRLQNVNQLGMTCVVYPGALHTRFIHSLGTLHVCGEMIDTCNRNAKNYSRLAPDSDPIPVFIHSYAVVLARLCALLHDLAHVPFGHTFEKEARVFEKDEWQDSWRENTLLGPTSGLAERLRYFFSKESLPIEAADLLREDIRVVLKTKRDMVHTLRYPFVHDLVGNTICADLIDYVKRDMYYCGLAERFGDRFLEYLAVFPVQGPFQTEEPGNKIIEEWKPFPVSKGTSAFPTVPEVKDTVKTCRVVLMNYRYNERREAVIKHAVFEEAIDLVRRRLSVTEKLLFHRTKVVASAMLGEAARVANLTAKEIWDLSDVEVLKYLRNKEDRAGILAKKILKRRLFKPIYRVNYHYGDESPTFSEVDKAYERFKNPTERRNLAERLEQLIGLVSDKNAKGSVVISCPDRKMNVKEFDMLVIAAPGVAIKRLQVSKSRPTRKEIEAIQDKHLSLWSLEVFVDPEVVSLKRNDMFTIRLAGAIQFEIGAKNAVKEFLGVPEVDMNKLECELKINRDLQELGIDNGKLERCDYDELLAIANRDDFKEVDVQKRGIAIKEFLQQKDYQIPK